MNEALAAAFHRRARLSRTDLGVDGPALRPSSAPEHVDIAVPGFVGTEYGPGGLCLVSVNPAGGKDAYSPTPGDKMIYDAAAGFIEAASDEVEAAFQALGRAFVSAMPAWGSQWRHVSAIIDAANAPLNAITYVYLVPFRTREDKGSRLPVDVQQKGGSPRLLRCARCGAAWIAYCDGWAIEASDRRMGCKAGSQQCRDLLPAKTRRSCWTRIGASRNQAGERALMGAAHVGARTAPRLSCAPHLVSLIT